MAVPEPFKRQPLATNLLDTAIYTLLHGDELKAAAATGSALEFTEKRPCGAVGAVGTAVSSGDRLLN